MSTTEFACPLCGFHFDPAGRGPCARCPLATGCRIICCPACGYQFADPQSTLIGPWLQERRDRHRHGRSQAVYTPTLADVPPGWRARIGAMQQISASRRQQLCAYGLQTAREVRVLQQQPVTVVQVGETELALEAELARSVLVDSLEP
ncbi:MAG TPA: FeoA domain-containing protein [Anaerolineales bacterium]|nr:FeoA domain-containing protein [Anaerolineales bacterium]